MFLQFELKVLNIKYHKENQQIKGRQYFSSYQKHKPAGGRYQVEIDALIIKFLSNISKSSKRHNRRIKKMIKKKGVEYVTRKENKVRGKKMIAKTVLCFYDSENHKSHETQNNETKNAYKRLQYVNRGDIITITFPMPEFKPIDNLYEKEYLIRSSNGNTIESCDFLDKKYPFNIENILIDSCNLFRYKEFRPKVNVPDIDVPIGLTSFGLKHSNKFEKLWAYIQYKIPAIPRIQYHFFHRHIPTELRIKRYISISVGILLVLLTVFPDFPSTANNLILRVVSAIILIIKEFL